MMWAMQQYLVESTTKGNIYVCVCFPFHVYQLIQQNTLVICLTLGHFDIILLQRKRKELKNQMLLDFEITRFQNKLAVFIMDEVLSKNGYFGIF